MGAGMWSGLYKGYTEGKERQRLEQERQDRLDLFKQERQDKFLGMAMSLAPSFAKSGVLTSSGGGTTGGGSTGGSGPSLSFYEQQLKQLGAPDKAILSLQEKGPEAMDLAIKTYTELYDPERGAEEDIWGRIAEGIVISERDIKTISVEDYIAEVGLDLSGYSEQEAALIKQTLDQRLNADRRKRVVDTATTTLPQNQPDIGDVKIYQDAVSGTLAKVAQQKVLQLTKTDPDGAAEWNSALKRMTEGDPTLVVEYLKASGELDTFMQPLFEKYPQMSRIPLGIWEIARPVPEAAIEKLRLNKDNPQALKDFEEAFGVDPRDYL